MCAKYTNSRLPRDYTPEDFIEDWGAETGTNLMYLNDAVQEFLKHHMPATGEYAAGQIEIKNYEGEVIMRIPLASVVYKLTIDFPVPAYILDSDASCIVPLKFTSWKSEIGSSETEEVFEDHEYTIEVQQGSSAYTLKQQGVLVSGASKDIDIRTWCALGNNTIRVTVTGVTTGVTAVRTLRTEVTSMYLKSNFPWWTPIVYEPGKDVDYYVTGLNLYASARKVVHVTLSAPNSDGTTWSYSQEEELSAYTNYTSATYRMKLNLGTNFPDQTTVGTITIWMTVGSQSSTVFQYDVMLKRDSVTPLIVINNPGNLVNFVQSTPFHFAVTNASKATIYATVKYGEVQYDLPVVPYEGIQTNVDIPHTITLEEIIETEYPITVDFRAKVSDLSYADTSNVLDNTYSFPPVPGAVFILNPAMRNNSEPTDPTNPTLSGPRSIKNYSIVPGVPAVYPANFKNFSLSTDAWYQDPDGKKCLVVPAGSYIEVLNNQFLANIGAGKSIEFVFKLSQIADFEDTILSIVEPFGTDGIGISINSSDIYTRATGKQNKVLQSVPIMEDTRIHAVFTITPNFNGKTGYNLCVLYINGIPSNAWDYESGARFGNAALQIGAADCDTDLYLYQMRVYDSALDHEAVVQNWLNSMETTAQRLKVQSDNDIIEYL